VTTTASGPRIHAIPMSYRGVAYRSTLEADWAATLDQWGWFYNYEPVALQINGCSYLPDFYLPNQRVWLEVKGPHNERIEKVHRLDQEYSFDEDESITTPLVVIARAAGPGDTATWEGARPGMNVVISTCPECDRETFMDLEGIWVCRQCWTGQRLQDHSRDWATHYVATNEKPFHRARREN